VRGGLTRRMIVASGLLALVVAAAFAVLLASITQLRGAEARARHSQEVLASANRLNRLVSDLETGQHEFLITAREDALARWSAARTAFPMRAKALERLVADNPSQEARAQRIAQEGTSYIQDYSLPLVNAARDPASARTTHVIEEGQQRIETIQGEFDRFGQVEANLGLARQHKSEVATQRAILAAGGGLAGSVLLIGLFAGYLTRAIVQPVRRTSVMAARLAGGDLATRVPEHGMGGDRCARDQFQHDGHLPRAQQPGGGGLACADCGRGRPGATADRARLARRHPAAAGIAGVGPARRGGGSATRSARRPGATGQCH
jgi:CHASE3 domain sensor protein